MKSSPPLCRYFFARLKKNCALGICAFSHDFSKRPSLSRSLFERLWPFIVKRRYTNIQYYYYFYYYYYYYYCRPSARGQWRWYAACGFAFPKSSTFSNNLHATVGYISFPVRVACCCCCCCCCRCGVPDVIIIVAVPSNLVPLSAAAAAAPSLDTGANWLVSIRRQHSAWEPYNNEPVVVVVNYETTKKKKKKGPSEMSHQQHLLTIGRKKKSPSLSNNSRSYLYLVIFFCCCRKWNENSQRCCPWEMEEEECECDREREREGEDCARDLPIKPNHLISATLFLFVFFFGGVVCAALRRRKKKHRKGTGTG